MIDNVILYNKNVFYYLSGIGDEHLYTWYNYNNGDLIHNI